MEEQTDRYEQSNTDNKQTDIHEQKINKQTWTKIDWIRKRKKQRTFKIEKRKGQKRKCD